MTTKARLIARCKTLGVMLLDGGDFVAADPAIGHVLAATGMHSITCYTSEASRPEIYAAIYDDLSHGLKPCDDPDCDSCIHEPMDFEAIQKLYGGERLA